MPTKARRPSRRRAPEVAPSDAQPSAYHAAGEDIAAWLKAAGHVLTALDGTSKGMNRNGLAVDGTRIFAGTGSAKLNSYDGKEYGNNRPFLKTPDVVRLAAFCQRSASETVALVIKNTFEWCAKSALAPGDPAGGERLTFRQSLERLAGDEDAVNRLVEPIVEGYRNAIAAMVDYRSAHADAFLDVLAFDPTDSYVVEKGLANLALPTSGLAQELTAAAQLSAYANELTMRSSWFVFGDVRGDERLAAVVRRLCESTEEGACVPCLHFHDVQGAFDIPGFSRFEGNIAQIPVQRIASLRLSCAVFQDGRWCVFPCGGGQHSLLSTISPESVSKAGIVDHLVCLADHLGRLLSDRVTEGRVWPYGLVVHRNEDFSLTPRSVLTCGYAIRYVYAVEAVAAAGTTAPAPSPSAAAVVAPVALRSGDALIMEDLLRGNPAGLRRQDQATVIPFLPDARRWHSHRFSVVPGDDGEGGVAPRVVIDVFPTPPAEPAR